jgi:hypothetical protein
MKLVADDKMLYPDLPADTPLNSQRNPEDQEWEDPINQVNILGIPTCKNNAIRNDGRFTAASTRGMRKRRDVEGEHPNRVSVTVRNAPRPIPPQISLF